ncbi:hypothetical protein D9756_011139 [Leucocoprinus leucothites]|uniref:Golgi apparatus membrane protein TVP38 n=1 Tax=Leucocoprinus leucothites TaxID=201217 RepID=A0A8H5CSF7_9AGAR|nr:hypothetical protein D9756_011139 [Leucoagaricus leucothites]
MPAPYDAPWQSSSYSLQDTEYGAPPSATLQSYPPYPPKTNYTNERSNAPNGHSYDPTFAVLKPPNDATVGSALRGRTPSPTPSEIKELGKGAIDWKAMTNWRFWIRREWLWYYVALVIILVLTALMTLYHKQIVDWLTPVTKWLHDLSFGWIVPIAVLFVISFPPLFGHEIVAILCGLVWGMWIGFAIVAAGTFIGEVGNFYAFKYCCRSRGEKLERTNISYACLAQVVREGGFKIALVARLSAIPGHFTTAIFSTCGMGIIVFSIAAILSMPKQFITVYLGVLLEQSAEGVTDKKSRIISDVVLAITVLITVAAMWYILREMNRVKPTVIHARRKARQAKAERQLSTPSPTDPSGHGRNPSYVPLSTAGYGYGHSNSSDSEIPLTSQATPMGYNHPSPGFPRVKHFQESSEESSYEPHMHAPKPQRPGHHMPPAEPEEDLTNARPLQHHFDPLSGRQAPYSPALHGSPSPIQPPPPSSDSDYGSRAPMNIQPPNSPPRNFSRPTPPSSPPRQSLHQLPPIIQSQLLHPNAQNPFASSDHISLAPISNQQTTHIPEESYDSFHTAHSASPEPMSIDDRLRPRAPQTTTTVHQPGNLAPGSTGRQEPPQPWNQPPPDYSFS